MNDIKFRATANGLTCIIDITFIAKVVKKHMRPGDKWILKIKPAPGGSDVCKLARDLANAMMYSDVPVISTSDRNKAILWRVFEKSRGKR